MADSNQRLAVMPSRMVLQAIKERYSAAKTGHSLLKKKSDAIKLRLREVVKKIVQTKRRMGDQMKESAFSHTEAQWAAGDFNNAVIENTKDASYKVKIGVIKKWGVTLPVFKSDNTVTKGGDKLYSLSKGMQEVVKCKDSYTQTLNDLVELASLQTALKTLDEALQVTNRRVNALEFVVMPMLVNTISYIKSELDELEREDTYRIKKVKDLRAKIQEQEDAEKKEKDTYDSDDDGGSSLLDAFGDDVDDITGDFD